MTQRYVEGFSYPIDIPILISLTLYKPKFDTGGLTFIAKVDFGLKDRIKCETPGDCSVLGTLCQTFFTKQKKRKYSVRIFN